MSDKVKSFVEKQSFQNFILVVIIINSIILGLQTSSSVMSSIGGLLNVIDTICLVIFIVELILKFISYRFSFFKDGWNVFDLIIIVLSILAVLPVLATMNMLKVFRVFRVFRSLKAVKTIKGVRGFRLISGFDHLRIIMEAIGHSLPGVFWSFVILVMIYYIFSIMGTTLFGAMFPAWFGHIGRTMYTLFQVMTFESWSMGIARPVMEVYPWAWVYFVPFLLITAFVVMNVVVGIVVNSISEVSALEVKAKAGTQEKEPSDDELKKELAALREHLDRVEKLLDEKTQDS